MICAKAEIAQAKPAAPGSILFRPVLPLHESFIGLMVGVKQAGTRYAGFPLSRSTPGYLSGVRNYKSHH
jgi:hypothetical protein